MVRALERLESRIVLDARVLITEVVASNQRGLRDEDNDRPDWIEIYNAGDASADLDGWHLTDDADDRTKWTFPAVTIQPQQHLVVFASGKNRADPTAPLHTNFQLRAAGEYLGLVRADDTTVAFEFAPQFLPLPPDRSYGLQQGEQTTQLIESTAEFRTLVPTPENGGDVLGTTWTDPDFDDRDWISGTGGVGFDNGRGDLGELISTDVNAQMYQLYTSAYLRIPFTLDNPYAIYDLVLSMKYDDGFVAYLNGQEVVRRNAPDSIRWNSDATRPQSNRLAQIFEDFDISAGGDILRVGKNVLAIHGMNTSLRSNDFLMLAELRAKQPTVIESELAGYIERPSAGRPNGLESYVGFAGPTVASADRGFYSQPFDVVLTADTVGSTIVYTTDGSPPSMNNGMAVPASDPTATPTATVRVSQTTTLRSAAFKDHFLPSSVDTQSYIFLDDVIAQPASPPGWPTDTNSWGRFKPDYEMDPDVVGPYGAEIKDDLLAIPTISIVMDTEHLFGETGILRNPVGQGIEWERLASVEFIHPDGRQGFHVNCAIRIAGSDWNRTNIAKRGFRLLFKSTYGPDDLLTDGPSRLEYPLFPDTNVTSFNSIVLKGRADHSYLFTDGIRAQYIREHWGRDTMGDMGHVTTHGTYAHLYLNGLYWGLYAPFERPDGSFQADYQGGDADQWYIINGSSGWKGDLGQDPLWRPLVETPDYETALQYLDMDNFIDYMMANFYGGNVDWPRHNWWAARENKLGAKYRFFQNDTEMMFYGPTETNMDNLTGDPGRLYRRLIEFPEFRLRFADRVQRHLFHDGALTPARAATRFMDRAEQIEQAIVGESARWGDNRRAEPYTRDVEWVAEQNRLLDEFFPTRTDFMVQEFRARGLYPTIDAPSLNQRGGVVPEQFKLELTAPEGTIYYTTDGSDPRLPGGEVSSQATEYTSPIQLTDAVNVTTRALLGDEWSAVDGASFVVAAVPVDLSNLRISEINYNPHAPTQDEIAAGHDNNDDFEFVEFVNPSDERVDLRNVRFEQTQVDGDSVGLAFDFGTASITHLDPGGRIVIVEDASAFIARYGDDWAIGGQWAGQLSNRGEQITVLAGDQVIHQFAYSDTWYPATDGLGSTLEIIDASADLMSWAEPSSWRASDRRGGTPGTATEIRLAGDANHDGVFDFRDLALVAEAGEYDDKVPGNSTFEEGDWNEDGDFDSDDLVFAFAEGHYDAGGAAAPSDIAAAVELAFADDDEQRSDFVA